MFLKNFLIKNLEFKIVGTMFFAAEVIIYALIAPFIGKNSLSTSLIWQMFIIAIILTFTQYSIYSSRTLEKISTWIKMLIHYITLLILGFICTIIFSWFDIKNIKNMIIAVLILTACFIIFSISIYLYYRFTGEEFNKRLKLYKSNKIK